MRVFLCTFPEFPENEMINYVQQRICFLILFFLSFSFPPSQNPVLYTQNTQVLMQKELPLTSPKKGHKNQIDRLYLYQAKSSWPVFIVGGSEGWKISSK